MTTSTASPNIGVALAVYRPNLTWLDKQLASVWAQEGVCVRLYVRDDCPEAPIGEAWFAKHCAGHAFSYVVNATNLGPCETFARLAGEVEEPYLALCDQDDIWAADKLETLYEALREPGVTLAYCGMDVIGKSGERIAKDTTALRKRDVFFEGADVATKLFIKNCIYGCTTLLPTALVRRALPLPTHMGHDHWFSLYAAAQGEIVRIAEPLVHYRMHGDNASNVLIRIRTKTAYHEQRIARMQEQCSLCEQRFKDKPTLTAYIGSVAKWAQARENWYKHKSIGNAAALWKLRGFGKKATLFELVALPLPEKCFAYLLRRVA